MNRLLEASASKEKDILTLKNKNKIKVKKEKDKLINKITEDNEVIIEPANTMYRMRRTCNKLNITKVNRSSYLSNLNTKATYTVNPYFLEYYCIVFCEKTKKYIREPEHSANLKYYEEQYRYNKIEYKDIPELYSRFILNKNINNNDGDNAKNPPDIKKENTDTICLEIIKAINSIDSDTINKNPIMIKELVGVITKFLHK